MARKARKASPRRGRRPFPWLWIGAIGILVAALFVVGKNRGLLPDLGGKRGDKSRSEAASRPPIAPGNREAGVGAPPDLFGPIKVETDWDRIRLRSESEFLRIFRGDDRAALHRLTSRTLRGALEEAGIGRERIDERPGTAAAA
ncbi:MAG TPA: hypothetical protein VFV24_07875, partial [Candidatus Eisenbacteria bacterium]|nr:hypothetical protein [Candidatus Eisenbacteria bacterium]